ncbi:hypothetical protein FQA39_LY03177 [Lamprigera yunnana]|nr:hypothetical protein FQA39_LY03177 [Lamprigera yunnana]
MLKTETFTKEEENNLLTELAFQDTAEYVDLQIQARRVMYVLDDTIKKLRIAACLPALLENDRWLKKHFREEQMEFIHKVCAKCVISPKSHKNIHTTTAREVSFDEKQSKLKSAVNLPDMMKVLEMLWNRKELTENLLHCFEQIADKNSQLFINCIKSLREVAQSKLKRTASEQRAHEASLRKAWSENLEMEEKILGLQKELDNQREYFEDRILEKKLVVFDQEKTIHDLLRSSKHDIRNIVYTFEKTMSNENNNNAVKLQEWAQNTKISTQHYEELLSEHLKSEKKLRKKRLQVESRLLNWINKFDEDMEERRQQYESIKIGYEYEKSEMQALQELFAKQEEEYTILMAEKASKAEKLQMEKQSRFIRNRAARIIQRFWRAYYKAKYKTRSKHDLRRGKKSVLLSIGMSNFYDLVCYREKEEGHVAPSWYRSFVKSSDIIY